MTVPDARPDYLPDDLPDGRPDDLPDDIPYCLSHQVRVHHPWTRRTNARSTPDILFSILGSTKQLRRVTNPIGRSERSQHTYVCTGSV